MITGSLGKQERSILLKSHCEALCFTIFALVVFLPSAREWAEQASLSIASPAKNFENLSRITPPRSSDSSLLITFPWLEIPSSLSTTHPWRFQTLRYSWYPFPLLRSPTPTLPISLTLCFQWARSLWSLMPFWQGLVSLGPWPLVVRKELHYFQWASSAKCLGTIFADSSSRISSDFLASPRSES